MAYNKYIKSGNTLEVYFYDGDICTRRNGNTRAKRDSKINFDRAVLLDNGNFAEGQAERAYSKRRDNARRSAMAFKRIILSNLESSQNPLLVTLTFKENKQSITECSRFFHVFVQRLRRKYGEQFRYISVPEFQKRGAVHYHALFWGLSSRVFLEERYTRAIASLWQQGFVFLKQTDGNAKLSSYLAKYMVKAIEDRRLMGKKAYFASRNIKRPTISAGFPEWWFYEDFKLSPQQALLTKTYMTKYMGKGRYELYNTN